MNKYQVISCYQASRASLQVIDISDAHDIITLVSAKQAYNARVKLYNETVSVCSQVHFPFRSCFLLCLDSSNAYGLTITNHLG